MSLWWYLFIHLFLVIFNHSCSSLWQFKLIFFVIFNKIKFIVVIFWSCSKIFVMFIRSYWIGHVNNPHFWYSDPLWIRVSHFNKFNISMKIVKKIFWQFFLFSFFFFLLFSFFVKSLIFGSLDFENSDNKIVLAFCEVC